MQREDRQNETEDRRRWPIPANVFSDVVERLHEIVTTHRSASKTNGTKSDRYNETAKTAVAAARVLVSIEAQNQADEHLRFKLQATNALACHVDTKETAAAVQLDRQAFLKDPEYINFLRERAAREDGYALHPSLALPPKSLEMDLALTDDRLEADAIGELPHQLTDCSTSLAMLEECAPLPKAVSRDAPERMIDLDDV